ncbi:MAG: hypothetical protein HFJ41_00805 [Clostridia bacterium]|nr:hypothetical protein [Clostridia bacterium]
MLEEGKTIAVLGSGFKHIYPEENINLANEIIKNGGTIISEYPPNTEVNLSNFPIRNRIIAGLADSTIVIEAKSRSGSSVTARHSTIQGKKVYCVPGRIDDKTGKGTNNLIKKGAYILTDVNEILIELGEKPRVKGKISVESTSKGKVEDRFQKKKESANKGSKRLNVNSEKYKFFEFDVGIKSVRNTKEEYLISPKENKKQIQNKKERKNNKKIKVKNEYRKIYELLSKTPMNIDEITRTLNINISEVNMKITMMEIEGLVEVLPGNNIKIKEN